MMTWTRMETTEMNMCPCTHIHTRALRYGMMTWTRMDQLDIEMNMPVPYDICGRAYEETLAAEALARLVRT